MAILNVKEYLQQFVDDISNKKSPIKPEDVIRYIRIRNKNNTAYDYDVLFTIIKIGKKELQCRFDHIEPKDADGNQLKINGQGDYKLSPEKIDSIKISTSNKALSSEVDIEKEGLITRTLNLSKKEVAEFISNKEQQDNFIATSNFFSRMREKWKIIQDPWNPSITPPIEKPTEIPSETPTPNTPTASIESSAAPSVAPLAKAKNISGKVTLKVKSGPGVIIGETEKTIADNRVDFSGIQFDQPGDYVISVVSNSSEVDTAEIKIKVLPEPEIVAQDESRGEDKPEEVKGTRPIIAQIDKPTIDLPPMEYKRPPNADTDTGLVAHGIGVTPFVNYMGTPINDRDIQSLRLFHDGIVPKMSIIFSDSLNFMKDIGMPQDNTKIEIFFNARTPNLKSIHLKFKIESFKDIGGNAYSIKGTLDLSELYRIKYKSYTGTSFEVLREISKELKIGFNSNIQNTDDKMDWRANGDRLFEFMQKIVAHSYISDNSFMIGYIDYYYCFNYVDIEKEMKRDTASDIGIETGNLEEKEKDDLEKLTKLILNNDKSFSKSCFYFESDKKVTNNSTKISIRKGQSTKTKFYDKIKKMFLVFDVDSTTSDESKSIILKGARGDKEEFENNHTTKYLGKMDTDNVHKNYNYSHTQNRTNLDNLNKMEMKIKLPSPNFNVYKFQKVRVQVLNTAPTPTDKTVLEWRLSGEWVICDIEYNFVGGKITQDIKLIRKEMGKNEEEMKENTVKEDKKEVKEQNENPMPKESLPNAVYKVGEVYTVQDKSGKKYTLTVKSLSEDGKDVSANIKEI